jgi:hypothetical protein
MLGLASLVWLGHVRLEYLLAFEVLSALLSPATELGQSVAVPMLVESRVLGAADRLPASSWDVAPPPSIQQADPACGAYPIRPARINSGGGLPVRNPAPDSAS